jgi:hypothetical protein
MCMAFSVHAMATTAAPSRRVELRVVEIMRVSISLEAAGGSLAEERGSKVGGACVLLPRRRNVRAQ